MPTKKKEDGDQDQEELQSTQPAGEEDQPHHKIPKETKEGQQSAEDAREQVLKRHEEAAKAAEDAATKSPEDARKEQRKKAEEDYKAAVESAPICAPWENPPPGVPRVEVPAQPVATGIPQQVSR